MERNEDEKPAETIIKLIELESQIKANQLHMEKLDKRMDLTIKRMVKAEERLEKQETRMEAHDKRMELFDKKLELSLQDLREFSATQREMNEYFLKAIRNGNSSRK